MKKILFIIYLLLLLEPKLYSQRIDKELINDINLAKSLESTDPDRSLSIALDCLEISKSQKNDSLWVVSATIIGHIYTEKAQLKDAIDILEKAFDLSKSKNLELLNSDVSTFLANFYLKIGSYNKALTYYNEAEINFEKHGDEFGIIKSNTGKGICFMYLANYDTASFQYHKALKIAINTKNDRAHGLILNNLGRLHKRKGEFKTAIEYLNASITILREAKLENSALRSRTLLADIYFENKEYVTALNIALPTKDSSMLLSDYQNIVRTETTIANIYAKTNNIEKANYHFNEAIAIGEKYNISQNQVLALKSYGAFLLNQKNLASAEHFINQGLIKAKQINTPENTVELLKLLEKKHELSNDLKNAYLTSKKRENLSDSLSKLEKYEMRERLEKEYKTQKFKTELANSEIKNLQNKETITWLAVGTGVTVLLIFIIYFSNKAKQKNIKLKYERNEAVLREKNLEIEKNKEIESAKAEIKGQEAERRRLAKELHDGLGGTLATIKLNLSLAESEFAGIEIGKEKANTSLTPIISSMDEACQEVRTISHHLLPKVFEKKSLSAAIEKYFNDISRGTDLDISFEIYPEDEIENINPATKNDIYRIIQELTNNILKHAEASSLDAQLIQHEDYLSLIVEDDGVGFPKDTKPSSGIGLQNINSRIVLLNGSLNIDSQPGRGTLIDIQIPNEQNTNGK